MFVGTTSSTNESIVRPKTIVEVQRRETYSRKFKRLQFPKIFKQKCRVCGDNNMLLNGEDSTECRNCGTVILRGEFTMWDNWHGWFSNWKDGRGF